MILDEQSYLRHYGTKGMKWGVRRARRRTERHQKNIDAIKKGTSSDATRNERFKASMKVPIGDLVAGRGVQGGSKRALDRAAKTQSQIRAGEKKAKDILLRAHGVNVKDLDFSYERR
jgi:hypothetical protein